MNTSSESRIKNIKGNSKRSAEVNLCSTEYTEWTGKRSRKRRQERDQYIDTKHSSSPNDSKYDISTDYEQEEKSKELKDECDTILYCKFFPCPYSTKEGPENMYVHNTEFHLHHPCSCQKCGKTFDRDRELNQHLLDEHNFKRSSKNLSRSWICHTQDIETGLYCGQTFFKRKDLWNHKKLDHYSPSTS